MFMEMMESKKKVDGTVQIDEMETIADSVQTEYCTTFLLSVCPSVTGVTSHISHIYKGINAMLIIKPYIF